MNEANPISQPLMSVVADAEINRVLAETETPQPVKDSKMRAIRKAQQKLVTCQHRVVDGQLIVVSDSGALYAATADKCQCKAYTEPVRLGHRAKPCWHRAGRNLMVCYHEAVAVIYRS